MRFRFNHTASMSAAALLLALAGSVQAQVQWTSGAAAPEFADAVGTVQAAGGRHIVVKLTRALTDDGRKQLQQMGLTLLAPLGDDTFFAATNAAQVNAGGLVGSGWLHGAAAMKTEWKMDRSLLEGGTQTHAVVQPGADPLVAVDVLLHEDVPASKVAVDLVAKHGGQVIDLMISLNGAVVHIPRSAVSALAAEDAVQWVAMPLPAMVDLNAENRALTGVNIVNAAPYNLNGAGVKVFVFDGGRISPTHLDLAGRVTALDTSTVQSHATHVAGTIGGTGTAVANNRGMAPGVTFLSAAVSTAGGAGWLYTNITDVETDYALAFNGGGAHIANNSIGTNTAPNGVNPCDWEGNYGTVCAAIDKMVRGDSPGTGNQPIRIAWAAGNERSGTSPRCGAIYGTTAPPAGAKNHMSIGSVESDLDVVSDFSSWGPTDDGRMKPDFCAPGCQTGGDGGVTSCTVDASGANNIYAVMCGTSMATPTITGISALLLQDFRIQFPSQPDPRNSTLKVLFAQSAVDRGNPGPDYQYGYGSVRAPAAIDLMRAGNWRQVPVSQGADVNYEINVTQAGPLALTLAWDDAPATLNAIPALINDIDLEVFSPSGVRAFPWTLDPNDPMANAVKNQPNRRDNIEQVRVDVAEPGIWHVRLKGYRVPVGPQVCSLVSSQPLTESGQFATVAFDSITVPELLTPGVTNGISATLRVDNDSVVAGSVKLHYRDSTNGTFTPVVMTEAAGTWSASLPPMNCADAVQFFITAQGNSAGEVTSATYSPTIGSRVTFFQDDFETDRGWVATVATTGGTGTGNSGNWMRMDPMGTTAQPENDTTPGAGVNCWVTDGRRTTGGATSPASLTELDVDGRPRVLTSPTFSMVGATPDTTITYMRWVHNNTTVGMRSPWLVEVSNNDGASYATLELLAAGAPVELGWRRVSKTLAQTGLAPTAQMRLRFTAVDMFTAASSIVEAAVDDVVVSRVTCLNPGCTPDFDGDGDTGTDADIRAFFQCLAGTCCPSCGTSDFNGDGDFGTDADIEAFFRVLGGGAC